MKTKDQKREEAKVRQEKYDALTKEQKLESLDKAFGKGKGAAKERAKLTGANGPFRFGALPPPELGVVIGVTTATEINKQAVRKLFTATPQELGEAAVAAAKKERKVTGRQNKQKARKS
jgi:hypothetical protein